MNSFTPLHYSFTSKPVNVQQQIVFFKWCWMPHYVHSPKMEQDYKRRNPRSATQTSWRRFILSKYHKFSGYVHKCNFIYADFHDTHKTPDGNVCCAAVLNLAVWAHLLHRMLSKSVERYGTFRTLSLTPCSEVRLSLHSL